MTAGGSTWKGYNQVPSAPSTVQSTFDSQLNRYLSYSGWGVNSPAIITSPISTTSGGNDAYSNPIVAYTFQTVQVPGNTVPSGSAWFTWLVSTGGTNGQKYSQIKEASAPGSLANFNMSPTYYNLIINYSGSTNIPAGTYRLYSTYSSTGFNITPGAAAIYFQGSTLVP
jgi:hypothetical protein